MPIYEFFCPDCNTIFNFYSKRINTEKRPNCPKCGTVQLEKMLSTFATIGKAKEEDANDPFTGMDETKMEQAFAGLMQDAEQVNEDDPRQMARLMRKFSEKTGLRLGDQMEEALTRMEAGDDPDQIEAEMGDIMDGDDAFSLETMKKKIASGPRPPVHDEKLYEL
ncbi:FmdB family zinc ribbon protein [Desulfogranum japonicum]|uniref:FmdB family zinc ribbon protein n=1 Tax=Desulfogranum japonicum TaxID=231447 RepID=UPI00048B3177|nr:zinc ribbon domain-containing protein [Desulfogranum japonicum]